MSVAGSNLQLPSSVPIFKVLLLLVFPDECLHEETLYHQPHTSVFLNPLVMEDFMTKFMKHLLTHYYQY